MLRLLSVALCTALAAPALAADTSMSIFVTSQNPGDGGNLGSVVGADFYCEDLAYAAGVEGKTWKAFLSTADENARERIGSGPWHNAKGEEVAADVDAFLSAKLGDAMMDQNGAPVEGMILTGSDAKGNYVGPACNDWTDGTSGSTAMISGEAEAGCRMSELEAAGSKGLFYCFAVE